MNLWHWFRVCRKEGHDWNCWKQVEALPVPFQCCRVCGKDAPEPMQREFFMSWLRVSNTEREQHGP